MRDMETSQKQQKLYKLIVNLDMYLELNVIENNLLLKIKYRE